MSLRKVREVEVGMGNELNFFEFPPTSFLMGGINKRSLLFGF